MKKKIVCIFIVIFLLISFILNISIDWLYETFENLSMEEIIFHLKVPMEGTNYSLVWVYIKKCLFKILCHTGLLSVLFIYPIIKNIKLTNEKIIRTSEKKLTMIISSIIVLVIFGYSVRKVLINSDIVEYISNQMDSSTLIATEYVDPKKVDVKFGYYQEIVKEDLNDNTEDIEQNMEESEEKEEDNENIEKEPEYEFIEEKRNLIYIFLESMETTYTSKENGGYSDVDLIPELTKIAKNNINFTNTAPIGGANALAGATWTVGAMTAQTAGIPLKISVEQNSMNEYSSFLGGAYTIGEILENNGYKNYIMVGSEIEFGGRKNLFSQHGNYEIYDYNSAVEEQKISEKVWWGFDDNNLFEFAKEKLTSISKNDEPFNFTMLTVDTHFSDGYLCKDCKNKYNEQYKNVLACSSKKVGEFINWIQKQDFYENTTIVVTGDHLTMQGCFLEIEEGQEYNKTVYNTIINSKIEGQNTTNRIYSTFDLYPTTLAAMGAQIEGNKLGLGVNLFSGEKTLLEKYDLEYVNSELKKTSRFYNSKILK